MSDKKAWPEMIGLREAATRTGLSYDYLRQGCLEHRFAHIMCGKKYLINFGKLVDFLETAGSDKE